MRISIIPEDKVIIVDKKTLDLEPSAPWDFDDMHDGKQIHAIQWKDGHGELEYEDIPGQEPLPNKVFDESEFDSIIKPYLDYYNEFLTVYEQKALESALKEEENIARQIEELNLDKLEKEAQLVIIEDLQRQNKELRDQQDLLQDEKSRLEQAEIYNQQTALMQLEREKIARESEYSALEAQKAEEYFKNKALELQKAYDTLYENFEKEKEAFIEERKQYQELLQMERKKIEKDIDESEKQFERENEERRKQFEEEEKMMMLKEEELELNKAELEIQRQSIDLQWHENKELLDKFKEKVQKTVQNLEMMTEHFEHEMELEREVLMREQEDILKKSADQADVDALDKILDELADEADKKYRAIQSKQFENTIDSNSYVNELEKIIDDTQERNEIESGVDYSVNDILTLMDQIDPEKLYTTLTKNENDENEFPVEKAVKWFSALKDVLDKNS